jgi:hypothetical protein
MILKPHSLLKLGFGAYLGMLYFDKIYALSGDGLINAGNGVYTASLAFSLPDAFDLTAGYRLPYTDEENGNAEKPDQFFAGVKLQALKDITLVVDAQLNGVSDNAITAMYGLTTAYSRDALKVGLDGVLQTKDGKDDPAIGFMLYGSYAIKKLLPRFDVYFGTGSTGGKKYYWKYFCEDPTYNAGDKFIGFRPSLTYNATSTMSIESGVLINGRMPDGSDIKFDSSVYLSFAYMF